MWIVFYEPILMRVVSSVRAETNRSIWVIVISTVDINGGRMEFEFMCNKVGTES